MGPRKEGDPQASTIKRAASASGLLEHVRDVPSFSGLVPVPTTLKSCLKKSSASFDGMNPGPNPPVMLKSTSSPEIHFGKRALKRSRSSQLRFSESSEMFRIDSRDDLLSVRDSLYYDHREMQGFVKYELKRRATKGIKSMSALAPEAEAAGEMDDGQGPILF
eukprot:CAMPEP_0172601188 /NCGR_PEP_ID=MMETSP1068-20121228/21356_1 /TAXON_ID=35684 /ORGANISM="Pseudopedinella elastica, Strain CCMP716" /LENGTH=162 /DNA_ID=CAMNT_0013402095 /DNA_START=284 /DNA_END=772 /DNA_ORIENTATION=-